MIKLILILINFKKHREVLSKLRETIICTVTFIVFVFYLNKFFCFYIIRGTKIRPSNMTYDYFCIS